MRWVMVTAYYHPAASPSGYRWPFPSAASTLVAFEQQPAGIRAYLQFSGQRDLAQLGRSAPREAKPRPPCPHSTFARTNSARSASVACTVSIASAAAPSSEAMASSCSDLNSIHSIELKLVMNL